QDQETGAAATRRAEDKPDAGDNTPNVDGDEGSAKGVSRENVAIGVEEKSAAINATKAKPKSSLLDPKDAVKTILEGLRGVMHSAVEKSGLMDVKAPTRKLFDSPTHLLEVCEGRDLENNTLANARFTTAALLFFADNPQCISWECMKCNKPIKNVRFCCETHNYIMCSKCVNIKDGEVDRMVCPSNSDCKMGVFPRKVPVLDDP
ncbi:unnamed protein product, partial [Ectocarpus sp. 8 AP-2014]